MVMLHVLYQLDSLILIQSFVLWLLGFRLFPHPWYGATSWRLQLLRTHRRRFSHRILLINVISLRLLHPGLRHRPLRSSPVGHLPIPLRSLRLTAIFLRSSHIHTQLSQSVHLDLPLVLHISELLQHLFLLHLCGDLHLLSFLEEVGSLEPHLLRFGLLNLQFLFILETLILLLLVDSANILYSFLHLESLLLDADLLLLLQIFLQLSLMFLMLFHLLQNLNLLLLLLPFVQHSHFFTVFLLYFQLFLLLLYHLLLLYQQQFPPLISLLLSSEYLLLLLLLLPLVLLDDLLNLLLLDLRQLLDLLLTLLPSLLELLSLFLSFLFSLLKFLPLLLHGDDGIFLHDVQFLGRLLRLHLSLFLTLFLLLQEDVFSLFISFLKLLFLLE